MKWILPKVGENRIINVFLWKPLEINGEKRWLEKIKIEQKFVKEIHDTNHYLENDNNTRHYPHHFSITGEFKWVNIRFVDTKEVTDEMASSQKRG